MTKRQFLFGKNRTNGTWTSQKEARLETLVKSGQNLTCSELGRMLGCSRNAIIGKVHRMGLRSYISHNGERTAAQQAKSAQKLRERAAIQLGRPLLKQLKLMQNKVPSDAPAPLTDQDGLPLSVRTVGRGQCRYSYDDPLTDAHHYCGAPVKNQASSWCLFHYSLVYEPVRPRTR